MTLAATILSVGALLAQNVNVSGTVIDDKGEPIIGAYVLVQNTTNGAATDMDGKYTLSNVPSQSSLVFSLMGYTDVVVPVNNKTVVNATLKEDAILLDDIVVVGFGSQKRANLTGAVGTVDADELKNRPISDVSQGLQGLSPGLTISYSSGQIGSTAAMKVRGTGTMIDGSASGEPLVLVDGIPTTLDMVNPDDVENISVLKDAASASIYGARGAFGVILITTKKGTTDKLQFSYKGSVGFSNPTKLLEHMEPIQELSSIIGAADARGEESEAWGAYHKTTILGVQKWYDNYADKRDPMDLNMVYGEDWENIGGTTYFYRVWDVNKLMFGENVPTTNHSFNMSGKLSDKSSIMASLGYNYKEGVMRDNPEELKRYNATVNFNTQLSDWLTADIGVLASRLDYQEPYNYNGGNGTSGGGYNGYFGHLYRYGAYAPYGEYKGIGFGFPGTMLRYANDNNKRTDYLRLSARLTAKIIDGLNLVGEYSISEKYTDWRLNGGAFEFWRYQGGKVYEDSAPASTYATVVGGSNDAVKQSNSSYSTNVFNAYAKYDKTFGSDHNFSAQLGANMEWSEFTRTYSEKRNLLDPTMPEFALATGQEYSTSAYGSFNPSHTKYAIAGIFARVNYDYKGKYLAEVNARYDGSSKFPTDSKWAIFPSGSIGWRVSEEGFMKGAKKVINNLKLRASAGAIGNQNIKANAFEAIMNSGTASWLDATSATKMITYGMPATTSAGLTWEKVFTYDLGADISLFRMFDISFDWYQRDTKGMLAEGEALPSVFGASAPLTNAGNLQTRGFELSVSYNKVINDNVSISVGAALSDSQSVVTEWNSAGVLGEMHEGMTVGEIWGLTSDRLIQESDMVNGALNTSLPNQDMIVRSSFVFGPGDMLYKDLDGDGMITGGKGTKDDHGDLSIIGNSNPRYEYNFRLGGEFYNFDVNMFFQGVGERSMASTGSDVILPFQRGYYDLLFAHQADAWTPTNTDAYYTRYWRYTGSNAMTGVYGSNNSVTQTKYLLNLAYMRFKNLTVGYTLPRNLTQKIDVDKVRVYFSGENLFTIQDEHLPIDPESTQVEHLIGKTFPLQRTLSFGIQVNF